MKVIELIDRLRELDNLAEVPSDLEQKIELMVAESTLGDKKLRVTYSYDVDLLSFISKENPKESLDAVQSILAGSADGDFFKLQLEKENFKPSTLEPKLEIVDKVTNVIIRKFSE